MHARHPLCTYPTAAPPGTPPSLSIWSGLPQFRSLFQWCCSQRMPTILWSYLRFSFSSGSILCTQWPLWCWWNVSRMHSFHRNMARGTTLRYRICRDWSRASWNERHDSRPCFSLFFFYVSRCPLPMRSRPLVPYSWNRTRRRYGAMGGKTKIYQWPPGSGRHPSGYHRSRCTPYWRLWVFLSSRGI